MQEKSASRRLTVRVTTFVVVVALYVASIGPFALACQHFPALADVAFVYAPLDALDNATERQYLGPYVWWWIILIPAP
jgi:hypothetical protein